MFVQFTLEASKPSGTTYRFAVKWGFPLAAARDVARSLFATEARS